MATQKKGGYTAATFIFAGVSLDSIGFVANMVSLVTYFMTVMHFDLSGSSTTLTNFLGSTFLLTVIGGFVSDTYLTRLNTILMFGSLEMLGYALLTVQAYKKNLHPDFLCLTCHLNGGNAYMFYFSLCLLALGFGGVRGALPALGADQFDKNHPKEAAQLASFFNWLLLSITLGASVGVTVIVWVLTRKSWALGFLIETMLALLCFVIITLGKRFYRVRAPGESPLPRVVQVIAVAVKNRKLSLPKNPDELYEIREKNGDVLVVEEKIGHSDQLSFLDKAAILAPAANPAEPWEVCSVTQVEEVKILLRMMPILASTILMNTCLAQLQTFSVHQGNAMDLHLGKFSVPPASIPVIPLVFMSILIPIYEFLFVPLARRLTGHPSGITHLQRVGVGLVLSAISMAVAAVIEVKRKNAFNRHLKQISLFWLSFQYGIFGIADMFTFVGLLEFFYGEAPAGMRSLSASLSFLSLSFGYFLSTAFVDLINAITRRTNSSGQGWLQGLDLNANHLDLFYWFLATLSCVNFLMYLLCAKWYKYRDEAKSAAAAAASITDAGPDHELSEDGEEKNEEEIEKKEKSDEFKSGGVIESCENADDTK